MHSEVRNLKVMLSCSAHIQFLFLWPTARRLTNWEEPSCEVSDFICDNSAHRRHALASNSELSSRTEWHAPPRLIHRHSVASNCTQFRLIFSQQKQLTLLTESLYGTCFEFILLMRHLTESAALAVWLETAPRQGVPGIWPISVCLVACCTLSNTSVIVNQVFFYCCTFNICNFNWMAYRIVKYTTTLWWLSGYSLTRPSYSDWQRLAQLLRLIATITFFQLSLHINALKSRLPFLICYSLLKARSAIVGPTGRPYNN